MLVAIPTVNNRLISMRVGKLTEVTYLIVENNQVIQQYSEPIPAHEHHHHHGEGGHHQGHHHHHEHEEEGHHPRRDMIKEKLCKADQVIYKSLCKNWQARLADCSAQLKRTPYELLSDLIKDLEQQEQSKIQGI